MNTWMWIVVAFTATCIPMAALTRLALKRGVFDIVVRRGQHRAMTNLARGGADVVESLSRSGARRLAPDSAPPSTRKAGLRQPGSAPS